MGKRLVVKRVGGSLVTWMDRICERKRGEPWWKTCTGSCSTAGTALPGEKLGGAKEMLFWWI